MSDLVLPADVRRVAVVPAEPRFDWPERCFVEVASADRDWGPGSQGATWWDAYTRTLEYVGEGDRLVHDDAIQVPDDVAELEELRYLRRDPEMAGDRWQCRLRDGRCGQGTTEHEALADARAKTMEITP